jgi:exosortase A-associated hydrolase 2
VSRRSISGQFIDGVNGPIFVLARGPAAGVRSCVLVVPPFAEEMNKCRRMVTEVALALADRGLATVLPDLYGTGDSGGDFADATWDVWQSDIAHTARWCAERGWPVQGVLGVRLGCALAVAAMASGGLPPVARSVLWQPMFDGRRFLAQFLRLRIAANLMADRKESLAGLRAQLQAGEVLEIAGYRLSSRLAADLDSLGPPDSLPGGFGEAAWLEVVRESDAKLPGPSQNLIEQTRTHGGQIRDFLIVGEPFWASTEVVVTPEIVCETVAHLSGEAPGVGD